MCDFGNRIIHVNGETYSLYAESDYSETNGTSESIRSVPRHSPKSDVPISLVREVDRVSDQCFYCHSPRHFARNCPIKTRRSTAVKSPDHVPYVVISPVPTELTTLFHQMETDRTHASRTFETSLDISNGHQQSDMQTSRRGHRNRSTHDDFRRMDRTDLYCHSGCNTDHYARGCPSGWQGNLWTMEVSTTHAQILPSTDIMQKP